MQNIFTKYLPINKTIFMAKKSIIEREKKRQRLVIKYLKKRYKLKTKIKQTEFLQQKLEIQRKLYQLPLNSSPVRLRNRCSISGRSRGYFNDFGLSRRAVG